MSSTLHPGAQAQVFDATDLGPNAQVDHNRMVLEPSPTRWDPFILLSDDVFSATGFPWHPHRGFQTLTLVLDGRLEHRDNAGGFSVLGPGDAQYMAAGRYAMHYELAHQRQPVHTLQLWINLPPEKKLIDTSYRDLRATDAALIERPGVHGRLHVGQVGELVAADPSEFEVAFSLLDLELDADASFTHELPADHAVAAYVLDGRITVGPYGPRAAGGQVAWIEAGEPGGRRLSLTATEPSRVVVYSAAPIGAPVVTRGPFVMNTEQEIADAFADFRAGRFGPVPTGPA